jgi:ferric iron reductase protein FhuF
VTSPDVAAGAAEIGPAEVAAAARRAGRINPLLGIELDPLGGRSAGALGDDAPGLIDAVRSRFGRIDRRIAASLVVLGYAARLVGPSVAILVGEQILVDLRRPAVRYAFVPEQGFRLTVTAFGGWRATPTALRQRWHQDVLIDHLGTLVASVRAVVPLAAALLWGNVASGLAGVLCTLGRHGFVPVDRCLADGRSLLELGPLRGAGHLRLRDGELRFVRRTCCLYYRIDGGGMCGDCALLATPGARRRVGGAA